MIYFRGCVVREKLSGISDATEKLLKLANIDYTVIENETCCGSFLMRTGFESEAHEIMEKTIKDLNSKLNTDNKILVSCAGCYNAFKNDYKELFDVDLDVVHTSDFFNILIKQGKLKLKKTPTKITYHDPCHLGRNSGIYEEPREIIKKTGKLIDMKLNREKSRCCGAGAGVKSAYPEIASSMASKRIQDAEDTRAELLVTACSFCILNLESAFEDRDKNKDHTILDVLDISELILMRLE